MPTGRWRTARGWLAFGFLSGLGLWFCYTSGLSLVACAVAWLWLERAPRAGVGRGDVPLQRVRHPRAAREARREVVRQRAEEVGELDFEHVYLKTTQVYAVPLAEATPPPDPRTSCSA